MKLKLMVFLGAIALAGPVLAAGDAEKGAKEFKKCMACHSIKSDGGEVIAKGGVVGPNLYGVVGRKAGSVEGFSYSDSMVKAGEAGLNWDEEHFKTYVKDATAFLRAELNDPKAKGKMTFKLKDDDAAANVWAYLASVGPK